MLCCRCGTSLNHNSRCCPVCGAENEVVTGMLCSNTILGGRYHIIKRLGSGGMGAVYKALDCRLNNMPVAIKEVSHKFWKQESNETPGSHEAATLAKLDHPAFPGVIDYFCENNRHYLVMKYIEGENLKQIVSRKGRIGESEVIEWALQLCDILEYLHSQKPAIIFRDLKPSNIMVTPEGKIRLIDFGIARHIDEQLLMETMILGSPGFASPEQVKGLACDARSDIYALGATLKYLLTGKNLREFRDSQVSDSEELPQVSPLMEALLNRMLRENPEQRPQSVNEVKVILTGIKNPNQDKTQTLTGLTGLDGINGIPQQDPKTNSNDTNIELFIDKIQKNYEKLELKTKSSDSVLTAIPVAGVCTGAGTTFVALTIANFLGRIGYSVIYIEQGWREETRNTGQKLKGMRLLGSLASKARIYSKVGLQKGSEILRINEIDIALANQEKGNPSPAELFAKYHRYYDYMIMDLGTVGPDRTTNPLVWDELSRSGVGMLVIPGALWHWNSLIEMAVNNPWAAEIKNWNCIVNGGGDSRTELVRKMFKDKFARVFSFPLIQDPFNLELEEPDEQKLRDILEPFLFNKREASKGFKLLQKAFRLN